MTHEVLISNITEMIRSLKQDIDSLKKERISKNNIRYILKKYDDIILKNLDTLNNLDFIRSISKDKNVKVACYQMEDLILEQINISDSDRECYSIFLSIKDRFYDHLSDTEKDFLKKIILNFKKNGVELNNYKEFKDLSSKINALENRCRYDCLMWSENIDLDIKLPEFLKDNKKITEDSFNSFMSYIEDSDTRKIIESRFYSKCEENIERFMELICLRDDQAKMLGCNNYIDMLIGTNGYADKIKDLLSDLIKFTEKSYQKEINTLKKASNGSLNSWDIDYLIAEWKKMYGVSEDDFSRDMRTDIVTKKVLKLYEKYFRIDFYEILDDKWSDDVNSFEIRKDGKLLGIMYLDLFTRINKIKHTKIFTLNSKNVPIVCISMSIKNDNIRYTDVQTFVKCLSQTLMIVFNQTEYSIFCGEYSETKFTDIYSKLYEKICWEKDLMMHLSGKNETVIKKCIKMRKIGNAIKIRRKIVDAYFDIIIHSSDKFIELFKKVLQTKDTLSIDKAMKDVYEKLYKKIMGTDINYNSGIFKPVGWLQTYESLYFGDLLSDIYASDLYVSRLKKNYKKRYIHQEILNNIVINVPKTDILSRTENYLNREINIQNFIDMNLRDSDRKIKIITKKRDIDNDFSEQVSDSAYSTEVTETEKTVFNSESIFIKQ